MDYEDAKRRAVFLKKRWGPGNTEGVNARLTMILLDALSDIHDIAQEQDHRDVLTILHQMAAEAAQLGVPASGKAESTP